ncbi:MAG TPA: response regulator [Polyangiaceae bacterium]|jgi:CheY-like chemotaxis protein
MNSTQDQEARPNTGPAANKLAKTGARVLVAEDDPEMRDMVATLLRIDGWEVSTVANGMGLVTALALASMTRFPKDGFDLIVTDVRMPGLTGMSAITRLRDVGYSTPVITITAFPDQALREQARALDILVLEKPFKLGDLREAANCFLGGVTP